MSVQFSYVALYTPLGTRIKCGVYGAELFQWRDLFKITRVTNS